MHEAELRVDVALISDLYDRIRAAGAFQRTGLLPGYVIWRPLPHTYMGERELLLGLWHGIVRIHSIPLIFLEAELPTAALSDAHESLAIIKAVMRGFGIPASSNKWS